MPRRAALPLALPIALLFAGANAIAHDYWLEPHGDDYLLYRGHRHSDHQGGETEPYDPAIVTRALCIDAAGTSREIDASKEYPARLPGPCAAVLVEADSGLWSHSHTTSQGERRVTWRALEVVKRIDDWKPALARPLAQGLEILSPKDPTVLKPGDKLRLLVTENGRPRGGVSVAYDGDTRGVTGPNGLINLKVRHGGPQFISASLEEPSSSGAEALLRSTVLMFDLR